MKVRSSMFGKIVLGATLLAVVANVRADECPRWISIIPLPEGDVSGIAADAIAHGNETLINGIAYMCNLTPEGDPAADRAAIYAKRYREVEPLVRKASKVKQGVLLQATMGHGGKPGQPTPWQTCVKPNGDSVYRFCPLDPRFLGYVTAQCRTLSDLKPDFFMLDDDTRLVWSDELPGCFCPLHLAALEGRTGRKWTREEVIAGLKAKDESLVRTWDEVKFDSLRTFYRTIRANITEKVPGMICVVASPAHFKHAKEIAEILAAPGQTPTVRGSGAPYHHLGKDLYHVIGQRYAYSRQLAAVGEGVAYMMEADTCPQTLWSTSATREYNELVMMALEGVKGAKIWITRLRNPQERRSQKVYRKAFSENRGIMEWAAKVDFSQQGVVIPLAGPVDKNFGDQYLSIMGFPYRFGTARAGEITALTAATVANLEQTDIGRILSGRVLLDGGAAVALAKLGYGKDIGVEAAEWQSAPAQAHCFEDGFVQNGIGHGGLVDLNRHDSKAQVLTQILHRPHMGAELAPVNPGSILFENSRGGRVLTLAQSLPPQQAWYFESDMQSETYKTQMARWLVRLADGVPGGVFYRGDGPVMCEAGTTSAGERIVVLDVLDLDGDDAPCLVFEQMPSRIERLQGDGSWRGVTFVREGDICRLESPVQTQRPAIFRIYSDGAHSAARFRRASGGIVFKGIELHNVVDLEREDDGLYRFRRANKTAHEVLSALGKEMNANNTGVELRFVMDDDEVRIILGSEDEKSFSKANVYYGDVISDWPELTKDIKGRNCEIVVRRSNKVADLLRSFDKSKGRFDPRVVRLVLPIGSFGIRDVLGRVVPPSEDMVPRGVYLAYGSSITHGSNALSPEENYASLVGKGLSKDVRNLGYAGSARMEKEMADFIAGEDFDVATLEMGVNVMGVFSLQEYENRVRYFVRRIAESHPRARILAIDIFGNALAGEKRERAEGFRATFRRVIADLDIPNVMYVNGLDLLPNDTEVSSGRVHPTPEGHRIIAHNLLRFLDAEGVSQAKGADK